MATPGSNPGAPGPVPPADEQRAHLLARKKAMLAAWVARLNTLTNNAAYRAIERRISRMLGDVEREERQGGPSPTSLEKRIDTWLTNKAGKVGGAEQEQDPTRPHDPGWHGERRSRPIEPRPR